MFTDKGMKVELLLDSKISGSRVTLFRVTYPRIVHAELIRHRQFSLGDWSICSSSSRAIPLDRMIEQYCNYYPTKWRKHQPGMQPNEDDEYTELEIKELNSIYAELRQMNIDYATRIHRDYKVAKEQVNRWVEPFSDITHLMQATERVFKNFFELRTEKGAQWEIRELAREMEKQYNEAVPFKRNYHVPFIDVDLNEMNKDEIEVALDISSARCARTSYFNHDGKEPNTVDDLKLAKQLKTDKHMSPFEFCVFGWIFAQKKVFSKKVKEHLAWDIDLEDDTDLSGNLNDTNLVQYRKLMEF